MKLARILGLALIAAMFVGEATAKAQYRYRARQYYSGWRKHTTKSYYYRTYYYKPSPRYVGYKHHYVVYFPKRPRYCYYYNPYKKTYWGRCPSRCEGRDEYSLLPVEHRKSTLAEIPEEAFPRLDKTPDIPESRDGEKLDLPPDDLPGDDVTGLPVG